MMMMMITIMMMKFDTVDSKIIQNRKFSESLRNLSLEDRKALDHLRNSMTCTIGMPKTSMYFDNSIPIQTVY